MQSFTGRWLKPKIFDGNTFPYQGENEKRQSLDVLAQQGNDMVNACAEV